MVRKRLHQDTVWVYQHYCAYEALQLVSRRTYLCLFPGHAIAEQDALAVAVTSDNSKLDLTLLLMLQD